MRTLTDFIEESLIPSIYDNPQKAFGGTWRRSSSAQRCREHILTDGHLSHDSSGGTYIRQNKQHIVADGSDSTIYSEVVKLYQERHNLADRYEAARALADVYGITFDVADDRYSSAEYARIREERDKDIADVQTMARLTLDDCSECEYLRRRGISDEMRRENDIFVVDERTAGILAGSIAGRHRLNDVPIPAGVEARGTHTIGVPIYEHGTVVACYFRSVEPSVTPKYKAWKLAKNIPVMFGLQHTAPAARRTLVVVEGVFDVIAAQAVIGKDYDVAGYLSSALTSAQAHAIAAAGYRNVIQVVDYDGTDKTSRTVRYVRSTAQTLAAEGITALVVDLIDANHPDAKQDANSFIQQFGAEAFIDRVKHSQHVTGYIVNGIARAAEHGTDEERTNARKDIIEAICAEPSADVVADILARVDTPTARLFGDVEDIRMRLADARSRAADEAHRRGIAAQYIAAAEYTRKHEDQRAAACLERAKAMAASDDEDEAAKTWRKWTRPITRAEIIAEYKKQSEGLITRWKVSATGYGAYPVILPSGAITAVTAPTKHGKTKMLTNVALLYLAEAVKHGKRVVIVHNEESRGDEVTNLVNVAANIEVDQRNKAYIRRHIQNEDDMAPQLNDARERIFSHIEKGTLVVVSHKPTVEEMAQAVTAGKDEIEAVIFDYIQRSRTADTHLSNAKDRIKRVMDIFNDVAASTGLPIITASQFNRLCSSPIDMDLTKNAEASDIEWTVALCIGIYSSLRRPAEGSLWYSEAERKGSLAKQIIDAGFDLSDTGNPSIYMRILADREGQSDMWGIMNFNGNTGYIGTNIDLSW